MYSAQTQVAGVGGLAATGAAITGQVLAAWVLTIAGLVLLSLFHKRKPKRP